jgi:predicted DsbA family dithiol-disulfide isomerase
VQWVYFPLHPDTPPDGRRLADLFPGRNLAPVHERMQRLMEAEGLAYGSRTHTYNSRLAQEVAKWADTQPGFDAVHAALYRAYFADARNIGDLNVLIDVASSVGLPVDGTRKVLTERLFKNAVDADWERARQYGVTGVPTFVCDGYRVVGAQPYEILERLVKQAGAPASVQS